MRPMSDRRVFEAWDARLGEAPVGKSRGSLGEALGQKIVSRTEGISELLVRINARVARCHIGQVRAFGRTPGRICNLSIGGSPEVR